MKNKIRAYACASAILTAINGADALSQEVFSSYTERQIVFRNGNIPRIREVLKRDFDASQKSKSEPDQLLILDELADFHTFIDENQQQVVWINKSIRDLLAKGVDPKGATFQSARSLLTADAPSSVDFGSAERRRLAAEADRRDAHFSVKQTIASQSGVWAILRELWSANSRSLPEQRAEIAERIADLVSDSRGERDAVSLAMAVADGAVRDGDAQFDLKSAIRLQLVAAYLRAAVLGQQDKAALETVSAFQKIKIYSAEKDLFINTHRADYEKLIQEIKDRDRMNSFVLQLVTLGNKITGELIDNMYKGGLEALDASVTSASKDAEAASNLHQFIPVKIAARLLPTVIERRRDATEVAALSDIYFSYIERLRNGITSEEGRRQIQEQMTRVHAHAIDALLDLNRATSAAMLSERLSSRLLLDYIAMNSAKKSREETGFDDKVVQFAAATVPKNEDIKKFLDQRKTDVARIFPRGDKLVLLISSQSGDKIVSIRVSAKEVAEFAAKVQAFIEKKAPENLLRDYLQRHPISKFFAENLFDASRPLMLLPEGTLRTFPFAALSQGYSANSKGRYLIEARPVFYGVSVASSMMIARMRPKGSVPYWGVGDPVLKGQFARAGQLPFARKEVGDLQAVVGGRAFLGADATADRLREGLRSAKIVHIAAHGLYNKEDPLKSMLLVPEPGDGAPFLTARDIFNSPIEAETVLLSACESGKASVGTANEINGFVRPFLFNGTKNILTTLWEVNDEGAYEVSTRFVKEISKRPSGHVALHRAMVSLIADGAYSSPYYWAPFAVYSTPQ